MKSLKPGEIKKLLFVRLRFIGDVIISTSVIKDLRSKYPELHLAYLAEKMPLKMLENNPDINELLEAEKGNVFTFIKMILKIRRKRYDAVLDVFGNPRSALLTLFSGAKYRIGWNIRGRSFCYNTLITRKDVVDPAVKIDCIGAYEEAVEVLGVEKHKRLTKLHLSESELKAGETFKIKYSLTEPSRIIGIQPGCRRGDSLTWPKEKYAELADRLIAAGYKVLLFGGPADKETNASVLKMMRSKPILAETSGIREDLALINICACFVTNNHGPVHMAVALKVPAVGLYRPDEIFTWFPYKDPIFKVLAEPENYAGSNTTTVNTAKLETNIAVEKVFNSVLQLLKIAQGETK